MLADVSIDGFDVACYAKITARSPGLECQYILTLTSTSSELARVLQGAFSQ
jgi:hypothetical protein